MTIIYLINHSTSKLFNEVGPSKPNIPSFLYSIIPIARPCRSTLRLSKGGSRQVVSEANWFLFEIGDFFSMPVTFGPGFLCRIAKMKTFCDTFGDTSRFQALINSVHAEIALHGFTRLRVPLGGSPWTGRNTGFATNT